MIVFENKGNLDFKVPVITDDKLNETKEKCTFKCPDTDTPTNYYMKEISCMNYVNDDFYPQKKSIFDDSEYRGHDWCHNDVYYNFSNKKVYLMKEDTCHYEYIIKENRMTYPLVTKFFIFGFDFNKELAVEKNESFQFIELINNDEKNLDEIEYFLTSKKKELTEQLLYKYYSNLAEFYYNIYPYITFNIIKSYNIEALKDLKKRVESFEFDSAFVDQVLNYCETAKQNTKVLNLLNKKIF